MVSGQNYTINQFAPETMAYVESCNNVSEVRGYWQLALHTDLNIYYNDVDNLHQSVKNLENQCKNRSDKSVCAQVISNFKNRLRLITEYERTIKNKMAVRNKRGIGLFLLGTAMGATGTLVYNWIYDKVNTANLQALLDKQTSVIDLTVRK